MKINTKPFEEALHFRSITNTDFYQELIKLAEAVNAMMPDAKLHPLNCPFCNTEAYIGKVYIGEQDEEKITISCNDSMCLISDTNRTFDTREEAIKKWNERKG